MLWRHLALIARKSASTVVCATASAMGDLGFRCAVFGFFLPKDWIYCAGSVGTHVNATPPYEAPSVFDTMSHAESAAVISAAEAARIVGEQWASFVEHRVQGAPAPGSHVITALVLTLGRHPNALDATLRRSGPGQRMALEGADPVPRWANGAKILVPGLTADAWNACGGPVQLAPFHVVALPEDVAEVMASLSDLGNRRPRPKPGTAPLPVEIPTTALFQDISMGTASSGAMAPAAPAVQELQDGACHVSDVSSSTVPTSHMGDEVVLAAWRHALLKGAKAIHPVHLNVRHTFLEPPENPVITPRSDYTASAPAAPEAPQVANPRIWAR
jgi:hypothetical protein